MIILIIEHDTDISLLFKEMMDYYNVEYKIANCGVDAYKILYEASSKDIDYVITNIGLPDENGVEIIKFIQKKFDSNIKIIVYSCKNFELYKDKIQCSYFLNKSKVQPFEVIKMIVENNLTQII